MLPYASLVSGACLFQGFFSSFAWQLCLVLRQSEAVRATAISKMHQLNSKAEHFLLLTLSSPFDPLSAIGLRL